MSKTVLITGANRGIGLAFVKLYQAKGWKVLAVCREPSDELANLEVKLIPGIDVASAHCAMQLKEAIGAERLDLVINNAGILRDEKFGDINYDTVLEQFRVNAMGPLRVSEALVQNLNEGAKIALVTSRMGSIADNSSGGRYGYRMSKAALNAAGMSLARDLKSRGVAVAILHPGYVATDMVGGHGDITPDVAAERLSQRIEALNLENSGTFWHSNGEVLPW